MRCELHTHAPKLSVSHEQVIPTAMRAHALGSRATFHPVYTHKKLLVPKRPLLGPRHPRVGASPIDTSRVIVEPQPNDENVVPLESPDTEESSLTSELGETVTDKEGHVGLQEEERKKRLWKAAIKLPMYWVALIPVLVGASLAFFEYGTVSFLQATSLVVSAVLIIGWLNLSNDAFDAETGVDETKPESVVNLIGNRSLVLVASIVAFVAGTGLLGASLGASNFTTSLSLLAFSIACGYVYQGPPFRWSYKGLGEPLCFLSFGPSATTAFFLAMSPTTMNLAHVPMSVWISSTLVGITTTLVLFCSHFHQHDGDKAAGKLSPIVRLGGTSPAVKILRWCSKFPFVVLISAVFAQYLPWTVLVCCGGFSLHKADHLISFAANNHRDLGVIARLKVVALSLHSSFGLALCLGLILARATGM